MLSVPGQANLKRSEGCHSHTHAVSRGSLLFKKLAGTRKELRQEAKLMPSLQLLPEWRRVQVRK